MNHIDPTERRLQLLALGYHIIPNKMKIPAVPGWNTPEWLAEEMTPARVRGWVKRFPGADTTGVRIEGGLVVIDIDVDDPLSFSLMHRIAAIAPEVSQRAPGRFGASEHKIALFCRLDGEAWTRIASRKYNGHQVEIFGGQPTGKGNASRQFGVYGPHSSVDYAWGEETPALHETAPGELPSLSKDQAYAIVAAFEELAAAAGWAAAAAAEHDGGSVVYDIDDETRFDTDKGSRGIDYAGLCDEHAAYSELRCAANFMAGDDGGNTSRCWVFYSARHNCVAVYDHGDAAAHLPKDMAPGASVDGLGDVLREAGVGPEADPPWRECYKGGFPKASLHNAILAVDAIGVQCCKDTFHDRLIMDGAQVTDIAIRALLGAAVELLRSWTSPRPISATPSACCARRTPSIPYADMLDEAEGPLGRHRAARPDGGHCTFQTEDTPLAQRYVRKTMIAAVARVRQPGIKDSTPS